MIDLRSDTVTRPSPAMREAMAEAEVGDDVFGEDPTVNRLQEQVAQILGKEAALYVPSGTMGNQLCIKAQTQPGDEVIVREAARTSSTMKPAAPRSSRASRSIPSKASGGSCRPEEIERAIRPRLYYMPRTRLICLENTHNRAGGTVYPLPVIEAIQRPGPRRGDPPPPRRGPPLECLRGQRDCSPPTMRRYFDSVSVCLSKGLGAPVGSVIAGSAAFIERARHYRKIFGGGMRQAGILAAAGLYALEHNVARLAEDHEKAAFLARELCADSRFRDRPGTVADEYHHHRCRGERQEAGRDPRGPPRAGGAADAGELHGAPRGDPPGRDVWTRSGTRRVSSVT